jgi:NADH-quinone oxidoreductase subunit M
MINHGILTGALFLLVGMVYERRHTRMIADYGGLAKQMPKYAVMFLIAALSSMGLPALNGFIGEFTILLGAANSTAYGTMTYAVFAAIGIVLGAAYLLWLYQRVFWGPLDNPANAVLKELNGREIGMMAALVVLDGLDRRLSEAAVRSHREAGRLRRAQGRSGIFRQEAGHVSVVAGAVR